MSILLFVHPSNRRKKAWPNKTNHVSPLNDSRIEYKIKHHQTAVKRIFKTFYNLKATYKYILFQRAF